MFILLRVTILNQHSDKHLLQTFGNIETSEILIIYQIGKTYVKGSSIVWNKITSFSRQQMDSIAFITPFDKLIVNIDGNNHETNVLAASLQHIIASCQKKSFDKLWWHIFSETSLLEKVALAHAEVWKSVMMNISIESHKIIGSDCITSYKSSNNPVIIKQMAYSRERFIFSGYPQDFLNELRIVGCGNKGLTAIPFQELRNAFQVATWVGICLTLLVVPACAALLMKREGIWQIFIISTLKVLLEQGNPFSSLVMSVNSVRFVTGLLLLMGVVLSNAYKNKNIYNMVTSRKTVPYKFLGELIHDNFKIFTRSSTVEYYAEHRSQKNFQHLNIHAGDNLAILMGEVGTLLQDYSKLVPDPGGNKVEDSTLINSGVLKAVSFHPEVVPMVLKKLDGYYDEYEAHYMASKAHQKVKPVEMKMLLASVENCNRSAVILPDHISREFQKELVREKGLESVFLGAESYSDIDWMFTLKGLVPPNVIMRIKRLSESGIWNWWMYLLGKRSIGAGSKHLEAASMNGNIIIVFALWGSGAVFAIASYVGENILKHCLTLGACILPF